MPMTEAEREAFSDKAEAMTQDEMHAAMSAAPKDSEEYELLMHFHQRYVQPF